MARYPGPTRIRFHGDPAVARRYIPEGRKYVGALLEQMALGGLKDGVGMRQFTTPEGITFRVSSVAGQHILDIIAPRRGQKVEEMIYLFVGSPEGLCIFDLGTKQLVETISGIENYEVDAVDQSGSVVWMTHLGAFARVNWVALTAIGGYLVTNTLPPDEVVVEGVGVVEAMQLSPDETKLLAAVGETGDDNSGGTIVVNEALGGFALLDSTDLTKLRSTIRMSFRPQTFCFAPDGRFFLGTVFDTDPGDVPSPSQASSMYDYIGQFDENGVLTSSRLFFTFASPPSAGFSRNVRALVAHPGNTRLYAWGRYGTSADVRMLHVFDIEDPAMPLLFSVAGPNADIRTLHINSAGTRLAMLQFGTITEYDITDLDKVPVLLHTTTAVPFETNAVSGINQPTTLIIQNGPKSNVGGPSDPRRWLYRNTGATGLLYAYFGFDAAPVYNYDLGGRNVGNRFGIANVGTRTQRIGQ